MSDKEVLDFIQSDLTLRLYHKVPEGAFEGAIVPMKGDIRKAICQLAAILKQDKDHDETT